MTKWTCEINRYDWSDYGVSWAWHLKQVDPPDIDGKMNMGITVSGGSSHKTLRGCKDDLRAFVKQYRFKITESKIRAEHYNPPTVKITKFKI